VVWSGYALRIIDAAVEGISRCRCIRGLIRFQERPFTQERGHTSLMGGIAVGSMRINVEVTKDYEFPISARAKL
jgi:hypothetical protein